MQVFPKLNRADAQGSAADYLRFVSEMYIDAPRFNPPSRTAGDVWRVACDV
jgi:hypothetical protein